MTDTPRVPKTVNQTPRAHQVADAALEVLAASGGRALTHRAVDAEAELPEGSTSNLFRTRDALVVAALDRHVERETQILEAIRSSAPSEGLTAGQAAALLSEAIGQIASPPLVTLTAARFELYLEVRRRPELKDRLAEVRSGYLELMAGVLRSVEIKDLDQHAKAVLAFTEGLTVDLLFHPESAMTADQRESALTALLESLGRTAAD